MSTPEMPKPPSNREFPQDQSMGDTRIRKQQTERLPEPTAEQLRLGQEAIRRALGDEEVRLYSDEQGRLCVVAVERKGNVERA